MRYAMRVLTTEYSETCERELKTILADLLAAFSPEFVDSMKPYWKCDGWGEIRVSLREVSCEETVKQLLASHWESDVCDSRWSAICHPAIGFIWLTQSSESNARI